MNIHLLLFILDREDLRGVSFPADSRRVAAERSRSIALNRAGFEEEEKSPFTRNEGGQALVRLRYFVPLISISIR